jgi:hypothetical protein
MAGASTDERPAIRTNAEHEHAELAVGIARIQELSEGLATMPVGQRTAGIRQVMHRMDADLAALEALLGGNTEREDRFATPTPSSEADRWQPEWRD